MPTGEAALLQLVCCLCGFPFLHVWRNARSGAAQLCAGPRQPRDRQARGLDRCAPPACLLASAGRRLLSAARCAVTSAKPGNGVELLRDGRDDTYWQSDGTQPHLINIQFQKKVHVSQVQQQARRSCVSGVPGCAAARR